MSAVQAADADAHWMQRALALAERGLFTTRPNPRVGCVLVRDGAVVGEGWHQRAGEPHAEVHALRAAGERAAGSTAYVTLEPCAHFGRTPPCADALVAAGVQRVVVAHTDPFAEVSGRGVRRLRDAGIRVEIGLQASAARLLNGGFLSRIERGRPWVRVKMAQSLDGRSALADGRSQWITSALSRADGHRWRARACAVLSGSGTLLADDPRLDCRLDPPEAVASQWRVLLDSRLRVSPQAKVWQVPGPVLWVHAASPQAVDLASRAAPKGQLLSLPALQGSGIDLSALLAWLAAELAINEVHVEAGARLSGALLAADLVDELLVYQAPLLLGHGARAAVALPEPTKLELAVRWQLHEQTRCGDDLRVRYLRESQ